MRVCQVPKPKPEPTCVKMFRECGGSEGDCCDGSYCKTFAWRRTLRCVPGSKPEPKPEPQPEPTCVGRFRKCGGSEGDCCDGLTCVVKFSSVGLGVKSICQ